MVKHRVLLILLVVIAGKVRAQCSDAGVCSITSHPHIQPALKLHLSNLYGSTGSPDNISVNELRLGVEYDFLMLTIPYISKTSPDWNYDLYDLGDIMISASTILTTGIISDNDDLRLSGGVKLPTGTVRSLHIPLKYQTGLGTFDILAGTVYQTYFDKSSFAVGLGIQVPLNNVVDYYDTLTRAPDISARIGVTRTIGKTTLGLDIIGIKRIDRSYYHFNRIYTDESSPDPVYLDRMYIEHSDAFQVNVLVSSETILSDEIRFSVSLAFPTLKRDDNTDGLKRSYSIGAGITFAF